MGTQRMRQFRSRQDDYERWKAIRLPYGDQDFSTVTRHALNQLYKELVEAKQPHESGWKAYAYRECETCRQKRVTDQARKCLACSLAQVNSSPRVVPASNGSTASMPSAAPIGAKKPRGKRTTEATNKATRSKRGNGSRRKAGQKGR